MLLFIQCVCPHLFMSQHCIKHEQLEWNMKSINESILQWLKSYYSLCHVLTCLKHITINVFFLAASTQPLKKKWKQQQKQNTEKSMKQWMPLLSAGKTTGPSGPDVTDGIRPCVLLPFRSMRQLTAKLAAMDSRVFQHTHELKFKENHVILCAGSVSHSNS